jgi:hypothetical protein
LKPVLTFISFWTYAAQSQEKPSAILIFNQPKSKAIEEREIFIEKYNHVGLALHRRRRHAEKRCELQQMEGRILLSLRTHCVLLVSQETRAPGKARVYSSEHREAHPGLESHRTSSRHKAATATMSFLARVDLLQ